MWQDSWSLLRQPPHSFHAMPFCLAPTLLTLRVPSYCALCQCEDCCVHHFTLASSLRGNFAVVKKNQFLSHTYWMRNVAYEMGPLVKGPALIKDHSHTWETQFMTHSSSSLGLGADMLWPFQPLRVTLFLHGSLGTLTYSHWSCTTVCHHLKQGLPRRLNTILLLVMEQRMCSNSPTVLCIAPTNQVIYSKIPQ